MKPESQNILDTTFATTLMKWYEQNKRPLPWRDTKDPYVIWLSEIILQQTRVQQGLPYFEKFVSMYPDIQSFAKAEEQDILKLWQGLGYYSRARNMLFCAQQVMNMHGGKFPERYEELLKLKGIGKYTAAAIASFAFDQPVPVIDGNVYRVMSRVFGIEHDIAENSSHKVFWNQAILMIPEYKPDLYNQAIMEFGALNCTPKSPNCEECIFKTNCFANKHTLQAILPIKSKKAKKKIRYFNYFVLSFEERLLIKMRQKNDIWKGLYEFLLIETQQEADFEALITNGAKFLAHQGNLLTCSGIYKHLLTHQTIFAKFFKISIDTAEQFEIMKSNFNLEEITIHNLLEFPVSRLIDKYLKDEIEYIT